MCRGLQTGLHAYFRSDANENRYTPPRQTFMSGCAGLAVCVLFTASEQMNLMNFSEIESIRYLYEYGKLAMQRHLHNRDMQMAHM